MFYMCIVHLFCNWFNETPLETLTGLIFLAYHFTIMCFHTPAHTYTFHLSILSSYREVSQTFYIISWFDHFTQIFCFSSIMWFTTGNTTRLACRGMLHIRLPDKLPVLFWFRTSRTCREVLPSGRKLVAQRVADVCS